VESLAVPLLLGCDFINKFVLSITPREGCLKPEGGRKAKLLGQDYNANSTQSAVIRVAQYIILPAMSETNVLVQSSAEGICLLRTFDEKTHKRTRYYAMAKGVDDLGKSQAFAIRMLNYSPKPIPLQNSTVLGHAYPTAELKNTFIISSKVSSLDSRTSSTETDDNKEALNLIHLDKSTQDKVRTIINRHASMWRGDLGELSVTKHRIYLREDARPMYQAPYRLRKKARKLGRAEVDRMLRAGSIEPETSEWAIPIRLFEGASFSPDDFTIDRRQLGIY
jgi:hypothetical protein